MKRIYFILFAVCLCALASAQNKKVETFDKNTWHWTEGSDKYQSVAIEDGYLVISAFQKNKKATAYQNSAKSFAKLPLRTNTNFKLTINYLVADYATMHHILFNTDKQCLQDDEETGQYGTYFLNVGAYGWGLNLGEYGVHNGKLPKVKSKGEYSRKFVIERKGKNVTMELDGIQIYEGECKISSPCIGFMVPLWNKKISSIKIDEIIIEQADEED